MFGSRSQTSRQRRAVLSPEALEDRSLMTGGTNTFAIIPGTISTPGQTVTIPFTINSQNFTRPSGRLILGVDVAGDTSTSIKPEISSVIVTNSSSISPAAAHPRITHAKYAPGVGRNNTNLGPITSAALVYFQPPKGATPNGQTTNPAINTTNPVIHGEVVVKATNNTTGNFLVGFYLPGDAAGNGVVSQADVQTVRGLTGTKAGQTKYQFNADANRDGMISNIDMKTTMQNEGVSTNILPTVSSNLSPADADANRVTHFPAVEFTGSVTPFATVTYTDLNTKLPAVKTTADSSGNYSVITPLVVGSNTFQITTHDSFGQTITGTINPVTYKP